MQRKNDSGPPGLFPHLPKHISDGWGKGQKKHLRN